MPKAIACFPNSEKTKRSCAHLFCSVRFCCWLLSDQLKQRVRYLRKQIPKIFLQRVFSLIFTIHLAQPKFTTRPENTEVLEGSTTELNCRVSGYPVPAIAWTKDGDRLPSPDRHVVLPSGTLRILFASRSDQGQYECQAINIIGVRLARAFLMVNPRG